MKKITTVIMLMCVSLLLFGCSKSENIQEPIVGSWTAIGVIADDEYTSFSGDDALNKAMADLYDIRYVTYNSDGTYQLQSGVFSEEGTWEKYIIKENLSYTYIMIADDGEKKLAGVMDENLSAMIIYDMDMGSDQVMLAYGKDGDDEEHIYFDYRDYVSDDSKYGSNNIKSDSYNYNSATSGETNALKKAKEYLECVPFSYKGLIEQLEYEGFSYAEAKYAADNCGADWYEQAAKKANEYLDCMSFSRVGLIEQLEYEGFTYKQAVYGVDKVY